ncbi:uncharacterized protein LOC119976485 [Scyliorhinus canicula]|uniref:uncharacterized protein LOC119976485 n=1 Tax=Scyliorhinus canicula TaxID=7830 RepID=UPI0018F78AA6|nr:uncharacterized protein LOC119976485 [Scyliorhinus canicula]
MAGFRPAPRFRDAELTRLLDAVGERRDALFPPPGRWNNLRVKKAAWEEVAAVVSAGSLTGRTAIQCKRKTSDLLRAAGVKIAHNKWLRAKRWGGNAEILSLTPYEELAWKIVALPEFSRVMNVEVDGCPRGSPSDEAGPSRVLSLHATQENTSEESLKETTGDASQLSIAPSSTDTLTSVGDISGQASGAQSEHSTVADAHQVEAGTSKADSTCRSGSWSNVEPLDTFLPELMQMMGQSHESQERMSVTFQRLLGRLEQSQSLQVQTMHETEAKTARVVTAVESLEHNVSVLSGNVQGMAQSVTAVAKGLDKMSESLGYMSQTQMDIAEALQSMAQSLRTIAEGVDTMAQTMGSLQDWKLQITRRLLELGPDVSPSPGDLQCPMDTIKEEVLEANPGSSTKEMMASISSKFPPPDTSASRGQWVEQGGIAMPVTALSGPEPRGHQHRAPKATGHGKRQAASSSDVHPGAAPRCRTLSQKSEEH